MAPGVLILKFEIFFVQVISQYFLILHRTRCNMPQKIMTQCFSKSTNHRNNFIELTFNLFYSYRKDSQNSSNFSKNVLQTFLRPKNMYKVHQDKIQDLFKICRNKMINVEKSSLSKVFFHVITANLERSFIVLK